mgnify:CR=1 FL=1
MDQRIIGVETEFGIIHTQRGDAAFGEPARTLSPDDAARLLAMLGLDGPLDAQFGHDGGAD